MKPALTAEEWAARQVDDAADGPSLINEHGELLIGYDAGHGLVGIERPHAIAALALYRQPFGFTREDVRLLRQHAKLCEFWEQTDNVKEATTRTYSLADHIEALLPTEEKSPALPPTEDQPK